jgi:osmotically inducible protein OsmC
MALERTASAVWEGDLKSGNGQLASQTGNVKGAYTYASRFENGSGTNPEELIAAAHAACYAMALSNELDKAGHTPTKVEAEAVITLDGTDITTSALSCTAEVPGIDEETFHEIANAAKEGCPVSKVLQGAEITLDATLA